VVCELCLTHWTFHVFTSKHAVLWQCILVGDNVITRNIHRSKWCNSIIGYGNRIDIGQKMMTEYLYRLAYMDIEWNRKQLTANIKSTSTKSTTNNRHGHRHWPRKCENIDIESKISDIEKTLALKVLRAKEIKTRLLWMFQLRNITTVTDKWT
jgi:hypothetical protein